MKIKVFLSIIAIGLMSIAQGQKSTIDLTLPTIENDSCNYPSNKGMIPTQGDNTVNYLTVTDKVLLLDYSVEIAQTTSEADEIGVNAKSKVQTTISMFVPETDYVCIKITDLQGRTIISSRKLLEEGSHVFKYDPGAGDASFFTAYWHGKKSSIKIQHATTVTEQPISLEYLGSPCDNPHLKSFKSIQGLELNTADTLLYSRKKKGLD